MSVLAGLAFSLLSGLAQAQPAAEEKRIYIVAPLRWDPGMTAVRPAQSQTPGDLGNLTGGIVFGMTPNDVNARLPEPAFGVSWSALPMAKEFSEDVRYFWVRLEGARDLRQGTEHCLGANSYVAFLFRSHGLFRLSYRLFPDADCPAVDAAAADIFARYVRLYRAVAVATHYATGSAVAVEVNDPTADYLTPTRWLNRER
jgi:hypothetical protein